MTEILGIVERLRDYAANGCRPWIGIEAVFQEAATAIEQARTERDEAVARESLGELLRQADALATGPNGRGGRRITIDFEAADGGGKLFAILSDIFNAEPSDPAPPIRARRAEDGDG